MEHAALPYAEICPALSQSGEGCRRCGQPLPPRHRTWCSAACMNWWHGNHRYMVARKLALARAEIFAIPRCREIHGRSTKPRLHQHSLGYACGHCGGIFPARRSRARRAETPAVQVNHIVQAFGLHGSLACVHHQENLEVLCESCHQHVTRAQARDRRSPLAEPAPEPAREAAAPSKNPTTRHLRAELARMRTMLPEESPSLHNARD